MSCGTTSVASSDVVITEEAILAGESREISMLFAREEVTVTKACYSAGEPVAGPHVHHEHTDAFYVLEGALTFQVGHEARSTTVPAGGFVAVPPLVAHSFRNDGNRPARWLTIHAHDGGFAQFMRCRRGACRGRPVGERGNRQLGSRRLAFRARTQRLLGQVRTARPSRRRMGSLQRGGADVSRPR